MDGTWKRSTDWEAEGKGGKKVQVMMGGAEEDAGGQAELEADIGEKSK